MFPTTSPRDADIPTRDWLSIITLLGALLVLYYLIPVVSLLVAHPPHTILARLTDAVVVAAAANSLVASTASTTIATILGLPLAYWLARSDRRAADAVTAIVVLPLVLPPVVSGMVLLTVFGPNAPIGEAAAASGVALSRSLAGVILAQTFVASPFVVITAMAAFQGIDRRIEYASRTLGKDRLTTVRHITLPLALPGIVAGITLAFARAMGEFGATIMMAYYPRTMPVQIWVSFSTQGLVAAFPVAVILLGISIAAIIVLNVIGSQPWY